MSTCTIIIKIKDYYPKVDSIPYQNFICLFTCEENEGQLPLVSPDNESFQHQIKNIVSDIKYKIHLLDYNDMSLIGMCEMVIPYNIISQINPPNGFIQEQQKKLLMDLNTKRRLFGTVLNAGDIYLNIYSEIYLSEKQSMNFTKSCKSTRRQKVISGNNKKIDGSPKTVKKKKLIMKMNSDRQALMNLNKNNLSNCDIQKNYNSNHKTEKNINNVLKPNNSFNYKEIQLNKNKNYHNISLRENKNKQKSQDSKEIKIKSKKSKDKKNIITNYNKDNFNKNYLLNRIVKTEINKNNMYNNKNNNNKKNKIQYKEKKLLQKNKTEKFENSPNNKINKITTIESLEPIDILGKNYISKSKDKETNDKITNNIISLTNSSNKEFIRLDKIIYDKSNEIKNDFSNQLQGIIGQMDVKNNFMKLIEFYNLLSGNLMKICKKIENIVKKSSIYKEKLFNELKKNNLLNQLKTVVEIKNFVNVDNHGVLNEKFLREIIKVKKSEFKIYQNIFNMFYYEYDILKWKEQEKSKKMEEKVKTDLLLIVFKNLIKNYGNISHIFYNDELKKFALKNCLNKYNIIEKEENDDNKNTLDNKEDSKSEIPYNSSKDANAIEKEIKNEKEMDKFKVINEVDEEKEEELDEEDKYCINMNNHNNIYQISVNSSNSKNNINSSLFNSNKKLKSNKKIKDDQKKLFDENIINIKNIADIESDKNNKNEKIENIIPKEIINKNEENNEKKDNVNISNQKNINAGKRANDINIDINGEKIKDEINEEHNDMNEVEENNINFEKIDEINIDEDMKKEIQIESEQNNIENNEKIDNEKTINKEINSNKQTINEIITNNIDSEKEEIKSLRNERKINEKEKEIESIMVKENDPNEIIEEKELCKNKIYTKSKIKKEKKKKHKKGVYDEEDLIIQKQLIEEFPEKCKEENIFIRLSKYEYAFGEETIKVALEGEDVILKLDEGDYKLQEFIEILNEGKEEENDNEENKEIKEEEIEEEIEEENNSIKNIEYEYNKDNSSNKNDVKEIYYSESSEKKNKKKRRKKRVNEGSDEDENKENEFVNDKRYYDKENYNDNYQDDYIKYSNDENKSNNYIRKRRKEYKI